MNYLLALLKGYLAPRSNEEGQDSRAGVSWQGSSVTQFWEKSTYMSDKGNFLNTPLLIPTEIYQAEEEKKKVN